MGSDEVIDLNVDDDQSELDTPLLDEEENDEGVDDDIAIYILNEICNDKDGIEDYCDDKDGIEDYCDDKDGIEDYCDDYTVDETNWSNIFLYSRG